MWIFVHKKEDFVCNEGVHCDDKNQRKYKSKHHESDPVVILRDLVRPEALHTYEIHKSFGNYHSCCECYLFFQSTTVINSIVVASKCYYEAGVGV